MIDKPRVVLRFELDKETYRAVLCCDRIVIEVLHYDLLGDASWREDAIYSRDVGSLLTEAFVQLAKRGESLGVAGD